MKIKIKSSQFNTYKHCLLNAITTNKIQIVTLEDKASMLISLNKIDNTIDLCHFIELHLDEVSYKKLRNATYQRKFTEENDLAMIKIRRHIADSLQEVADDMNNVTHEQAIEKLITLYWNTNHGSDQDFILKNEENETQDINDSIDLEDSFTLLNFDDKCQPETIQTNQRVRYDPNQQYVERLYDGELVTLDEAWNDYSKRLKERQLKSKNIEVSRTINEIFNEVMTIENITQMSELCHTVRRSLITKGILSDFIEKDQCILSKAFNYAEYEEDAYAYQIMDMMVKCFGVEFILVTKSKSTRFDSAMAFSGMPVNVQAAYDIYQRFYKFFKTYAKEKMNSFHKNTKLAKKRLKVEFALLDVTNNMYKKFNLESGSEYGEYDFLDSKKRQEINSWRGIFKFDSFYGEVY